MPKLKYVFMVVPVLTVNMNANSRSMTLRLDDTYKTKGANATHKFREP